MKPIRDSWEDSWDDMTKYHQTEAPAFAVDVWGWWRRWQARKLKGVMDRSRLYWARKREQKKMKQRRRKTEMMFKHRRIYREMLREIREEAVREAKE